MPCRRWRSSPVAEQTGLIHPIGRWVLHEACRQLARWRSDLPQAAGLSMSVNVSARQLQDASIVEDVESALRETGLDPGSLILELTESAGVENIEGAAATGRRQVGPPAMIVLVGLAARRSGCARRRPAAGGGWR